MDGHAREMHVLEMVLSPDFTTEKWAHKKEDVSRGSLGQIILEALYLGPKLLLVYAEESWVLIG